MNDRFSDQRSNSSAPEALVVAITETPLVGETVATALDEVAVVARFPPELPGLEGLVGHIAPDALVVDSDEKADQLAGAADSLSIPLVHISLVAQQVRVLRDGRWSSFSSCGTSPDTLRNVLVGVIYGTSILRRSRLREPVPR
jgi:hypothetical protein